MKVWNSASFFFFWCGTVGSWLANLANFNLSFFFPVFVFLNLAVHILCSLVSYTPALITIFFFFWGPVVQPEQCLCVVCLWVVCCVFVCYKCFCFWWVCLCVGLGLLVGVFVCCVFTYYPSFNFGIETWKKNNLKKFWKSYNINNIGFFFCFFLKDFTIQLLLINIILVAVH